MTEPVPVAIVGVGLRLPGGIDRLDALAGFLEARGDGVREVPPERWSLDRFYDANPDVPGRTYVRRAGFLDQSPMDFDPAAFGISPREAASIDPQQRLLLETTWEAFEDAGLDPAALAGSRTGVYVGGFTLDQLTLATSPANVPLVSSSTALGMTMTVLSARIAYTFDLRGPCLTVDTACSSSLVAMHLACRALAEGECDLAVVGGVNSILAPPFAVVMSKGHFLAPDGRSKAFDAAADGYGRGEGAGVVLLERLDRAQARGRRVHGVLRGTGVNQDGRTDGMAMPREEAQYDLIVETCARAGVDPATVDLVEAHGTGTKAGDPIEARALGRAYGGPGRAVRLGSIKTNVGHLEAAAGVTGLLKATLSVRERRVYPQRTFTQLNPEIPFADLGLRVAVEAEAWPTARVARAAVNSFGYGGTNAHALVEEPPAAAAPAPARPGLPVLPLAAFDRAALRARADQLLPFVEHGPAALERALARRPGLRFRAAAVAATPEEARARLADLAEDRPHPDVLAGEPLDGPLTFVYTGMGPQWAGMGRELAASDPVFGAAFDEVDAAFRRLTAWSPADEMARPDFGERIRRNDVAQALNFVLQVALTRAWAARGVTPALVVGHSVGEVAAAWATGCLDLDQAVRVSWHRSRLQQKVAGLGTMLAVGLGERDAVALIPEGADAHVAAINAVDGVTLAGSAQALATVAERATARGVFNRLMPVEVAYHSPHMNPLEGEFYEHLAFLCPEAPRLPLISTVTGRQVQGAVHDSGYWWANARQPVRLLDAANTAIDAGARIFLEVGPHPVLGPSLQAALRDTRGTTVFSLKRKEPEERTMARALAALWCAGAPVAWVTEAAVALPPYPWQRQRHWTESDVEARRRTGVADHPLLDRRLALPSPAWVTELAGPRLAFLEDHVVEQSPILPGAATIELGLAAARQEGEAVVTDVRFLAAVPLVLGNALTVVAEDGRLQVHYGVGESAPTRHATMNLAPAHRYGPLSAPPAPDGTAGDVAATYAALARRGLRYGPEFRTLRALTLGRGQAWALLSTELDTTGWLLHPTLLDGAFQATLALAPPGEGALLPVGVERVRVSRPCGARVWAWIRARRPDALLADLVLYDDAGPLAEVVGLRCALVAAAQGPDPRWFVRETWERLSPEGPASVERWTAPEGDVIATTAALRERLVGDDAPLVVVTRGARSVAGESVDPAQRALWGLARVARAESPRRSIRLVDLPLAPMELDVAALAALPGPATDEFAIREGSWFGAFVETHAPDPPATGLAAGPFELVAGAAGRLDTLHWRGSSRRAPGPGEVELEVRAVGLNFKDLMKAMGMLSKTATDGSYLGTDLGLECAGVVVRAGEGARHQPGDRVFAYVGGAFRSHITVSDEFTGAVPAGVSLEEAASLFVYTTAWHALVEAARLAPGERVLVHAAAGGVGLAAVHIARAIGAEIHATAGSEAKRAWLRELGIAHVYDSRTLDFADGVRAATGGAGVDVVVNTLAGPALDASLDLLAPAGRFVELGKQDITSGRGLPMLAFNRSVSFISVDLDRMAAERKGWYGRTLDGMLAAFADGRLPMLPVTTFPPHEVEGAFRHMAGAKHIGKIVVTLDGAEVVPQRPLRDDRSYLVTGGLRGFGMALAHRLVASGARHVWLCSRSGRAEETGALEELRAAGATVHAVACDVADRAAVDALVARIDPPLAGVFHAAALMDDALLHETDAARFAAVVRAKAVGAMHLDRACGDVEHFVLFSSVAALVGNPAQGAYAAANAALDGLAEARNARGWHGLSIAWGAIGDTGMVARDAATAAHLRGLGLAPIPVRRALSALELAMQRSEGALGVIDLDWDRWVRANPAASWARLDRMQKGQGDGPAALTPEQRRDAIRDAVVKVLRVAPEVDRPLREYGLDSIVAVELAAAIDAAAGVTVSTIELLAGATVASLAARGGAAAAPADVEPTDLRGWILANICVQPPYFALDEVREDGEWLRATVAAGPKSESEWGPVSLAEAGRHIAILGSAAVRRRLDQPGRIYFPVVRSWLVGASSGVPAERWAIEARFVSADITGSRATAEGTLRGLDGEALASFGVEYHVIPHKSFEAIFAVHARPTSNAGRPYDAWTPTKVAAVEDRWEAELGAVDAAVCEGHFDGFPAYPVSILFRRALDVVAAGAGRPVFLVGGEVRAQRFAWAGEPLRLVGRGQGKLWSVLARVGQEDVASFNMRIA